VKGLVCFLAIFICISCSQNAVKEENSVNENITKTTEDVLVEKKVNADKQGKTEEINQEQVKRIFKNLTLKITDKKSNRDFEVTVPVEGKTSIANTSLEVEIIGYFPDFVMDEVKGAITKSLEERNPAAKVNIYKDGKISFKGWLFANFPDIHAFEDSDYDVKLMASNKEN
jgi:hypothetical protein